VSGNQLGFGLILDRSDNAIMEGLSALISRQTQAGIIFKMFPAEKAPTHAHMRLGLPKGWWGW
jgi:hypothetical protein